MLVIGVDTSSLMEVALRKSPNGKGMPLWKHEFYGVYKTKTKTKNKRHVDIYQVLEFRIGGDMPPECREGLTDAERHEIWVKGMYFAPAINIQRANLDLRHDRYIFQHNTTEEWEAALQYKAALGKCPELVMVTNCTCWHNMSEVLHVLPRVVHPEDVQTHKVYVNGRDWHYLCGVAATEELSSTKRKNQQKPPFTLTFLLREQLTMYPEEKLGGLMKSPSSQWDNVDALFQGIRNVMSCGTACTSGTFSIPWSEACQQFWEV
jgi:hypothetical protein